MGGRKRWPQELADRCNAVGWPAELVANGHWKAKLPDGTVMSWAESPSDGNAYKNAMRVARNKGLDDLETKLKLQREKERLERIERDRERNGVPDAAYSQDPQPAPPTESGISDVPEKKNADPSLGFVEIEGQRLGIVEQAEAWYQPNRGGDRRLVEDARELLLIDHSVYYQCLRGTGAFTGAGEVVCNRLFTSPQGVFIHQGRVHKPAEDAAQQLQPHPDSKAAEAGAPAVEPGLMARLDDVCQAMMAVSDQAGAVADFAERVYKDACKLAQDLAAEVGSSEELRRKAEKFDTMLKVLGQE